jgi:hypothetical protein|tara:strand:+ start:650 stop:853 length:204 start_codon:yes stop_codon:yes gene_type:complete
MSIEDLGLLEFKKLLKEKRDNLINFQEKENQEPTKKPLFFPKKNLKDNTLMSKKDLKHYARFGRRNI